MSATSLPKQWRIVALAELCNLTIGKTPSRKRADYWMNGTLPWATIGDMNNGIVPTTRERITQKAAAETKVPAISAGTILLSFKLSIGKVARAVTDLYTNEAIAAVAPKTEQSLLADYLYYYLQKLDIVGQARQAVKGKTVNKKILSTLPVVLPPVPVQERIVRILQKADEVADKRRQASLLSDAILPSVFNDMFVNPDAASNDYPQATIGAVTTLVTSGYTPRGGARNYVDSGPLLIRSQNVRMLSLALTDCACLPEHVHEEMSRVRVMPGDVLLNITGASIGRVAWASEDIPPANVNQHVCIIRPDPSRVLPEYLAYTLATPQYQHIILNAPGSAQTGFNHARVRALEILVPPIPVQRSFVMRVQALREVQEQHTTAYQDVDAVFNALLEQAFTGALTAEWEAANAHEIAEQMTFLERLPHLLLLALLLERAKRAGKKAAEVLVTALMKYAFLFQTAGNGRRRLYCFVPYHYGPFAKELYADLERLAEQGLVRVDNESDEDKVKITLTDPAKAEQALAELPADLRDDAATIIETYGDLDHNALLRTVYEKYPAYAKKSRLVKKAAKKSTAARPQE